MNSDPTQSHDSRRDALILLRRQLLQVWCDVDGLIWTVRCASRPAVVARKNAPLYLFRLFR
jgi:hypothetical protein